MLAGLRLGGWLAGLAVVLAALGGPVRAAIHVQRIDREQGLPSTQVHAVAQAPDGAMWFAGPSGLSRYDGGRITPFGRSAGLSSHGLRSIEAHPDGRLWIGTDVGVDVLDPDGSIRPLVPEGSWSFGFVEAFAPDPDGGMWIATARGLLHWTSETGPVPVAGPGPSGDLVTSVAIVGASVWAAGPAVGLWKFDGEHWIASDPAEWSSVGPPLVVASARGRGVLVGGERGLVELDLHGRRLRAFGSGGPESRVSAVMRAPGGVWVGMGGGLELLVRGHGRFLRAETVLESAPVNDLLLDKQGNVWIATDNAGVGKISALHSAIRRADRPCPTQVFSIHPSRDGSVLIGGDTCSWRSEPRTLEIRERFTELDRVKVWDLREDADGRIWAATQRGLFVQGEDGRLARHPGDSAVLRGPGRVLLPSGRGMWVGTQTGLARVEDGEVREVHGADGASLGYVYTLEAGPDGAVWIGTIGNGLWRTDRDGVPQRVEPARLDPRGNVYSLDFLDERQSVVSINDRLMVVGPGGAHLIRTTAGEVAGWSVVADGRGAVWVGGTHGLVRYETRHGEPLMAINRNMGLSGNEFTTSRSLWRDEEGRLYCGLEAGLSLVDPDELAGFRTPPVPRLYGLAWTRARAREEQEGFVVDHGAWTLDVWAYAPWFLDERSLTYQHRLRGFDQDWSAPAAAGVAPIHYTGLPSGRYVLEVRAHSPLVGWGPSNELLEFQVLPAWWRHPVLAAGAIAAVAGLIALAWRWRSRALVRRNRELERRVNERTAELMRAMQRLEQLATHDELTGMPNQRSFWEHARRLWSGSGRHADAAFALVLIDLDHFKRINDTLGHRTGDDVLKFAAGRLASQVRGNELLARYGGEEFVALLSPADADVAVQVAERMRRHLSATPFRTRAGDELTITASFGVAAWQGDEDTLEDLFRRADAAMYEAKRTRDRVACASADRPRDLPAAGTG